MIRWGPVILIAAACSGAPQTMCTPRDQVDGTFCLPDSGQAANIDVKLQVRPSCSSACDHGIASCEVRVDGGSIVLAVVGQVCIDPGVACPASCALKTYDCALPALPDGTYTVNGTAQLQVGAGGSPGCRLP